MKRTLLFSTMLLLSHGAFATPSISSITGNFNYGGAMTVNGSGFGTKPVQQQTYFFANFEDASAGVAGTTWCVTSTMGNQQNVSRKTSNCFEGVGCLGNTAGMDSNNNNTANVSHTNVGASGKMMDSFDWRLDGTAPDVTGNWKTHRWWTAGLTKNNFYSAQQIDGGFVGALVETQLDTFNATNMRFFTDGIRPQPSVYTQVEYLVQQNSAGNATDGTIIVNQGNSQTLNSTAFESNTTNDTAANGRYGVVYPVHMVWTGAGSFESDNAMYYDNIIVDTSWCQVWVSTSSTNAAGGTKYWLPVQTWASGVVTAVMSQKFSNGQQLYVYARENGGTVNSSGSAITYNGGSGGGGTYNPSGSAFPFISR